MASAPSGPPHPAAVVCYKLASAPSGPPHSAAVVNYKLASAPSGPPHPAAVVFPLRLSRRENHIPAQKDFSSKTYRFDFRFGSAVLNVTRFSRFSSVSSAVNISTGSVWLGFAVAISGWFGSSVQFQVRSAVLPHPRLNHRFKKWLPSIAKSARKIATAISCTFGFPIGPHLASQGSDASALLCLRFFRRKLGFSSAALLKIICSAQPFRAGPPALKQVRVYRLQDAGSALQHRLGSPLPINWLRPLRVPRTPRPS